MQLLVGSVEDADLRSGSKLWLGMKENSMFILLMFILAYRYHRAGANGIGQTPFETSQPLRDPRASTAGK